MANNGLNRNEAVSFIEKVEKERAAFRKALKESSLREEFFDLTINRESFTNDQTIDLIEFAIEKKGILHDFKTKIEFH